VNYAMIIGKKLRSWLCFVLSSNSGYNTNWILTNRYGFMNYDTHFSSKHCQISDIGKYSIIWTNYYITWSAIDNNEALFIKLHRFSF